MKKFYLLLPFMILLFTINSCTEDEETLEPITTDISVTSSESLIIWTDENDLSSKLDNALSYDFGNALESEILKELNYNIDTTQVTATINFKQEFQNKYYDSNLSNNTKTIDLQKLIEGTGLLEYPTNYNTFPTAQFPTTGVLDSEFELDMPPSRSQGSQGSCTAWAVGYGMQSFFRKNEFSLNYTSNGNLNTNAVCSPSYIYNQIKVSDCFSGSYISDALDLLQSEGVCSLFDMSYNVNDCDLQPNQQQINNAIQNKITEWNTVQIDVNQIKLALSNNHPVVIAAHLYEGFYNPSSINNQDVWNVISGNSNGYHAMVVYGWNDSLNAFNVLNSWGNNFSNNGSIWIDYNLFNGVIIDQAYIAFNEQTQGNSNIVISSDIDFGNVQVNTNSTVQTLTVTNTGNSSFNIINISSSNNAFTILNGQSTSVPANSSIVFDIQFSPSNVQTYNGVITVDNTADNANSSNSSIQVTGVGVNNNSSAISISGNLNFGDVETGQSSTRTFTISNTGNQSFNVSSISFPSGVYTANWNSGTINAGSSQNVTVTFQPTNVQSYNGTVTVNHNADSGNNTISISGNGINNNSGQPNLRFYEYEIQDDNNNNNGIIEAGEDIDFDIRLENFGSATATNIEAIISTTDPDITISDNDRPYDDMPQGDLEWNSGAFDFQVSSSHPTSTVVFNIQINSSEGTWNDTFTINVQGSGGGNPIPITPTDLCADAPTLQMNTEYEVNINTSNYGSASPIDGQSAGGNSVRGFWLEFNQPSGYVGDIEIQVYDVSSNFDPVIGTKLSCGGIYYTQSNSSSYVANDNGYGGSETFTTYSGNNGYTERIRIYHYYGSETGNISFKIKIEEQ